VSRAPPRLIAITDPAYAPAVILAQLRAALGAVPPGALSVQVRDFTARPEALARDLRELTRAHGAMLLVNRDVALAVAVGADGVHFGGDPVDAIARAALGEGAWLTVAAHSDEDVRAARRAGADAALVSPIFASPGKGPPRGTDAIARARQIAPDLPLYALGGVDAINAVQCRGAGATGVAAIRSLFEATDPAAAARALCGG
jgi:thiamine-phosphate pyrophosphorylase